MSSGNIANKDDAQKCVKIAEKALAEGNVSKAVKFVEKSLRLYPSPEAEALQKKIIAQSSDPSNNNETKDSSTNATTQPEGMRKRTQPQAGASSTSSSKPRTDGKPTGGRVATAEQIQIVRRLRSTKNLYERLGVERNADEAALKRAYRKLSIKVHPDKNPADGADEAFKALNKAMEILADPSKRRYYDQTGEESPQAASNNRGNPFQHGDDPEELLRQFFGPGFRMHHAGFGPGFAFGNAGFARQRRRHPHQQQQRGADELPGQSAFSMMFMVMALSFFLSSFSSLSSTPQKEYSFTRYGAFTKERITEELEVKYYVTESFELDLAKMDRQSRKRKQAFVERKVENDKIQTAHQNCLNEKYQKQQKLRDAKRYGSADALAKVKARKLRHCDEYKRLIRQQS